MSARFGRIALVALLVVIAPACRRGAPAPPETHAAEPGEHTEHGEGSAVRVHCAPVARESLRETRTLRGSAAIAPDHFASVAPQVPGRILRVTVREGDAVTAGAVLVDVEAQPVQDALTQARAALAQVEAAEQNAALTQARSQRLFERGIAARQEVDDATMRRTEARAQVSAARAAVAVAARNVARATVRAPFAGVVLRLLRRPGELVDGTPATPVLELGDPAALEFAASAAPSDLVQLHAGQEGSARFDALSGMSFAVRVATVSPAIDPTTGTGAVRLTILPSERRPPSGLPGVADVDVGEVRSALVVPASALRGAGAAGTELVVCDGEHARVHTVSVGARHGERVEITQGVGEHDRVATDNVLGLADGADIEVAANGAAP